MKEPRIDDTAHRRFPDGLPDDLLDLRDRELLRALGRPTLIRVPGTGEQAPRAVATLLHGDESTGLRAIMRILRRRHTYPFDLYVVVGNVPAALADDGFAHRYLDEQEDFNRIWGLGEPTTRMRRAADGILEELRAAGLESLVDIHNNSGDNPFYAIVTRHRADMLNLATLFTTTLLSWDLGAHTLMEALDEDCAAIAVECGLAGAPESAAFALDGLRRYLGARSLETDRVRRDYDLLGGLRKVMIRPEVTFRFGGDVSGDADFAIAEDADMHNFVEVPEGHVLGHVHPGAALPIVAFDAEGNDVTDEHFTTVDDTVITTRPAIPVMMTRTVEAARKDCLFYLATELGADPDAEVPDAHPSSHTPAASVIAEDAERALEDAVAADGTADGE